MSEIQSDAEQTADVGAITVSQKWPAPTDMERETAAILGLHPDESDSWPRNVVSAITLIRRTMSYDDWLHVIRHIMRNWDDIIEEERAAAER